MILNNHLCSSQLNGCCGEWTNGDDMSVNSGRSQGKTKKGKKNPELTAEGAVEFEKLRAATNKFYADERKRRAKEASNKVFSHNGEVKSKVAHGPRPEDVAKLKNYRVIENETKEETFPLQEEKVEPGSLLAGGVVDPPVVKKVKKVILFLTSDFSLHLEDVHKRIVVLDKPKDSEEWDVRIEIFETLKLPAFRYFKRFYQPCKISLSPFLYRFINSKLLCMPDESRNFTVCRNFAAEHLYMFPARMVEHAMAFYAFKLHGFSVPSGLDSYVPYDLGLSVNLVVPITRKTTQGERPFGYAYNGAWTIVKSKGFDLDLKWDSDCIMCVNSISFETVYPPAETHRGMTQYFSFTPQNRFVVLANSGRNICDALARYFKAVYPGEEKQRRTRQMCLLNGFPPSAIAEVSRVLGARFAAHTVTTRMGNRYYIDPYGSKTFFTLIDSILSEWFWFLLWLVFLTYMANDTFRGCWNFIIYNVYAPMYGLYDYSDLIKMVVKLPHPKRCLYQRYVEMDDALVKVVTGAGNFESKFKYELAKVGEDGLPKAGRLYATAGELALADYCIAQWISFLLKRQDVSVERSIDGIFVTFKFLYRDTQSAFDSDAMYLEAKNLPRNTIAWIYFSDDGYVVANLEGEVYIFETDFSSCDSTNGFAMFVAVYHICNRSYCGNQCLKMLRLLGRTTVIHNPDARRAGNPAEYVELQPEDGFLYSGHKFTSIQNDCANVGVGSKLVDNMTRSQTLTLSCEIIEKAAYDAGYKMTVVQRTSFNASTFLKRAYSVRNERSWLVYGAMFRSWGLIEDRPCPSVFNLSPREFKLSSDFALTEILIKQRVEGLVNEPPSPLLEAMRVRAGLQEQERAYLVDYEDLNERYGTETWEWGPLIDAIIDLRLGDVITSPALEKIFSVDYGTTPVFKDDTHVVRCGASAANNLV